MPYRVSSLTTPRTVLVLAQTLGILPVPAPVEKERRDGTVASRFADAQGFQAGKAHGQRRFTIEVRVRMLN